MTHKFQAMLNRPEGIGTWTYLDIPFDSSEAFGSHGQIRVKGTIDDAPFRSTLMPDGSGGHFLVVNKAVREQIGKSSGDMVSITLHADGEPREIEVPDDFQAALSLDENASAIFEELAGSHKKRYIDHINAAKAPETRMRRIDKAVEVIAGMHHRK